MTAVWTTTLAITEKEEQTYIKRTRKKSGGDEIARKIEG
jgi:hypothetical protein